MKIQALFWRAMIHIIIIPIKNEILEVLNQGKDYEFFQGDYISIIIKNRTKTIATRLMELFYSSDIPDEQILITYGGMIRDEMD
jgi:hypothetical protein